MAKKVSLMIPEDCHVLDLTGKFQTELEAAIEGEIRKEMEGKTPTLSAAKEAMSMVLQKRIAGLKVEVEPDPHRHGAFLFTMPLELAFALTVVTKRIAAEIKRGQ